MKESTTKYKSYDIEIHSQPKTGDNTKVFFRIWQDKQSLFCVWDCISGTESRKLDSEKIIGMLKEKGLTRVKALIDNSAYLKDKEYTYWETVSN